MQKTIIPACLILALAAPWSAAIPPYAQLFKAKYRYRPNCTLCHDRASWEPTEYGKMFHELGRNMDALTAMEKLDPDGDGSLTEQEIQAKSNPGDPRSTPQRVGPWLKATAPVAPPAQHLRALFAESKKYKLHDEPLNAQQVKNIERQLNESLRDEEKYPVYFAVGSDHEPQGFALYASTAEKEKPCFFLAGYGLNPEGTISVSGIRMLACPHKALTQSNYLAQFSGKSVEGLGAVKPPKNDLEKISKEIAASVRRGAFILREAAVLGLR